MDGIAALFHVEPGATEPIYRQLVEQVRRRIAAGLWEPGDELPSVRDVAHALAVNPMTVSKAFSQLEAQGVLERRRGLSMVVAARSRHLPGSGDRLDLLRPSLERAAVESRQLSLSDAQAVALFKTILLELKPKEHE